MLKRIRTNKSHAEFTGWILYLILTIYSAINIAGERYGSPDDLSISMMQNDSKGIIEAAKQTAIVQGRIHQIIFFSLNNLALNENFPFMTPLIKFTSVVLIFVLFSYLIAQIYNNKTSLLASLMLMSTVVTTGEYNALNSFPLWFTLGLVCFLISLIFFQKLIYDPTRKNLALFSINFAVALVSSEIYFLLILTYPLLQLKIQGKEQWYLKFKTARKTYLSITSISILYFFIYIVFKVGTNGTYEGASLTLDQPLKSLASTVALSFGQTNIYAFKRQVIDGQLNFHFLIAFVFLLIFVVLYEVLGEDRKPEEGAEYKEIVIISALALLGNIILGFTVKYSSIGLIYPLYLNSLISHLFVVTALSLIILKFCHINWFKFSTIIFLSVFGYISVLDQSKQYDKLRMNQNVFKVVDCFTKNPEILSYLRENIVSNDIAVLSKAYSYNYFGAKMRDATGNNYFFFRDKTVDLDQLEFSEVQVNLDNKSAAGQITNFTYNKPVEFMAYKVSYEGCKFELNYLTGN